MDNNLPYKSPTHTRYAIERNCVKKMDKSALRSNSVFEHIPEITLIEVSNTSLNYFSRGYSFLAYFFHRLDFLFLLHQGKRKQRAIILTSYKTQYLNG